MQMVVVQDGTFSKIIPQTILIFFKNNSSNDTYFSKSIRLIWGADIIVFIYLTLALFHNCAVQKVGHNSGSIQVSGDVPTLPWVRSRV